MTFKEISTVRLVCRRLNELSAAQLNSNFRRIQNNVSDRFQRIESQMPRRRSARRTPFLPPEYDIIIDIQLRFTTLQLYFGKYIERGQICFFPGEILDETSRILATKTLDWSNVDLDELCDLTTMAVEFFEKNIEPTLPKITHQRGIHLECKTPTANPSTQPESPPSYNNLEPEYKEGSNTGRDGAPQPNMALRKLVRKSIKKAQYTTEQGQKGA